MEKIQASAADFSALFNRFKRRLFETSFMYKYGNFFDILNHCGFPYQHWKSDPYDAFINALADSWNEFGGCDSVYSETPCQILFAFYNRFTLLESHLKSIAQPIFIPKGNVSEQFRYIFIDYLYASGLEKPYPS